MAKSSGSLIVYQLNHLIRDARVVHVYVSALLFGLLIFFSLTGWVLNHPEWFQVDVSSQLSESNLQGADQALLAGSDLPEWQPDLNQLQSVFRRQYGLGVADQMSWDRNFDEISFEFSAPGGYALVYLDTRTGAYELLIEQTGWLEVLNDLHKGRHAGTAWRWVIDLSAFLMLLFAVSGLILLIRNHRFQVSGFALVLAGTLLPVLIFLIWVPQV